MSHSIIEISQRLAAEVDQLKFDHPVAFWYNPLSYAWDCHRQYLERFAATGQILLLGMNPGPFGMAQTGIPFGAIPAVRDWMGLDGSQIGQPANTHPKRPVLGFACPREEPSGKRLWGFFSRHYPQATDCFRHFFVVNYCPLVFMDQGGANLTPDKLRGAAATKLGEICHQALADLIAALQPRALVGVGKWATTRLAALDPTIPIATIPHPSPANPQANRNWSGLAETALREAGLWPPA